MGERSLLDEERALLAATVRSAGNSKSLARGREIHCQILASPHAHSRFLSNLLIEMYGKCGSVEDAEAVYERIREPNLFTNNILIACYARNGQFHRAESLFDRMPQKDSVSWTAMITAYSNAAKIDLAKNLFDRIPVPSPESWNALASAYTQNGQFDRALDLLNKMPNKDLVSWNSIITERGDLNRAKTLFDSMPKSDDLTAWNSMLAGYAARGNLQESIALFQRMPAKDTTSWTNLVLSHISRGDLRGAQTTYQQMPQKSTHSSTTILTAFAQRGDLTSAEYIFTHITPPDTAARNAMLAAYSLNGHLEDARRIFDAMPDRDAISWTSLISAYAARSEALVLFARMDLEGAAIDRVALVAIADACADLSRGRMIHSEIRAMGFHRDRRVGTALITMYSRSGSLEEAALIFEDLPERDAQCWNSMMAAYAQLGHIIQAVRLAQLMCLDGVRWDGVTLLCLLSSCSHGGAFQIGYELFRSASTDFSVARGADHYGCMVDLLGRAGWMEQAQELLDSMPFVPDLAAWTSFITSGVTHHGTKVSRSGQAIVSQS
ncbi:pentatricopeptide repeat-containing protein At4g02750-like [Selaginella moellendorffii]|uniref:pentatricopeptide repeat-containing protein At4g02750-like n=1 Tax=Selaginella moellendorffii TaxID=88036 RepID=UPI000D1C717F|nr:pentatricopeptide repeat-containing protein At4g02750-like [Selaginella moellendorffii]|eukprot:XP_024538687.1 pentatricopeptide repeat-containing protein At4g02750-like [Selaginella moellendorffii]